MTAVAETWVIRPAVESDLDHVVKLERATPTAPHWVHDDYRQALTGGSADVQRCLLIAAMADTVVGFAVASCIRAGQVEAELESVAVQAEWRGRGIGWALCEATLEWSRELGACGMQLEVRAVSKGVHRLYRALGFIETGRRPRYYRDPIDDAVILQCRFQEIDTAPTPPR
jgi:ribosomal-protein-alanine N-acetyltransferase